MINIKKYISDNVKDILKTEKNIKIQSVVKEWMAKVKVPNRVKVEVDIDPYSFF